MRIICYGLICRLYLVVGVLWFDWWSVIFWCKYIYIFICKLLSYGYCCRVIFFKVSSFWCYRINRFCSCLVSFGKRLCCYCCSKKFWIFFYKVGDFYSYGCWCLLFLNFEFVSWNNFCLFCLIFIWVEVIFKVNKNCLVLL